jgi:hypothetical protein
MACGMRLAESAPETIQRGRYASGGRMAFAPLPVAQLKQWQGRLSVDICKAWWTDLADAEHQEFHGVAGASVFLGFASRQFSTAIP